MTCAAAGLLQLGELGQAHRPELVGIYLQSLIRSRDRYRSQRLCVVGQDAGEARVVVIGSELSHNAAGRAHTLMLAYQHLGYAVRLLGCHVPQGGYRRQLWEPLRSLDLDVHAFVLEDHSRLFAEAWKLVLNHPADLVHLSKPRLPAVVFGLLYKLLWGASVLMDIDDEELCLVGEQEPLLLDQLKRQHRGLPPPEQVLGPRWTQLAVTLGQRFDGITVANRPLQQRYGGVVIPHARDPDHLQPATPLKKRYARRRYGIPEQAKVVLFFG